MDNVHQGIAALNPYQPGKPIDELARELGISDIVKLASNENPRGPGAAVQEAIAGELAALSRYPDGNGFILKEALVSDGIPFTAFEVDDLDAEYKRLLDVGVSFVREPIDGPGARYAVLDDTCGNLIQIYEIVD